MLSEAMDGPALIRATRERLAARPPAREFPVIPDFPTPDEEDFCPRCGVPSIIDPCERSRLRQAHEARERMEPSEAPLD